MVIFYDSPHISDNYMLFSATAMGLVPHVFTVVQPHPTEVDLYRYARYIIYIPYAFILTY